LGEGHAEELIPAREAFDLEVPVVALDALPEFVSRNEIHQLGENGFPVVHGCAPLLKKEQLPIFPGRISNR
jgi:hypothetical protein